MNFIKWLLKSVGPYVVGILIGIGFAYLLVDLLSNPLSLPGQAVRSGKDAAAKETPAAPVQKPAPVAVSHTPASAPAPVKAEEPPPPPPPVPVAAPVEPAPVAAPMEPAPVVTSAPEPAPMEPAPVAEAPAPATEAAAPAAPWGHPPMMGHSPMAQPPMAQPPAEVVAKCGQPPRTPGYAMSRYYACLWQQQCEARQSRALEMIRRSKEACPKSGANAQLCQNYYTSLEQQYQSGMCPQQWNPAQAGGQQAPAAEAPANPEAPAPAEAPAGAPQPM